MKHSSNLPADAITSLRRLVHDLSNSLETILQASYLLGQAEIEGKRKQWAQTIETAARQGAGINREISQVLKALSAKTEN